jgi:hypothetical protein
MYRLQLPVGAIFAFNTVHMPNANMPRQMANPKFYYIVHTWYYYLVQVPVGLHGNGLQQAPTNVPTIPVNTSWSYQYNVQYSEYNAGVHLYLIVVGHHQ